MSHHHLTREDREYIVVSLQVGLSFSEMAAHLGRHRSTLSREIRRNGGPSGYSGVRAQNRYQAVRQACRRSLKVADPAIQKALRLGMEKHWSPEQVVHREELAVSVPTVYRAIHRGLLEKVQPLLRRKGKRYTRKGTETRGKLKDCTSIEARPKDVENRALPGHWEGDTVLGAMGKGCVATLVERTSRFVVAFALPSKASEPLAEALLRAMEGALCRSITVDNGKEFAQHRRVGRALGVPVYFAHPHSPWERGTNENTNGLLREFLPKGKDLRALTQEELDGHIALLNNRPRKCLGWRTPAEVYRELAPPCCV